MTRRLLVSHLSIAALVLVVLEVPLGLLFASHEHESFVSEAQRDATLLGIVYEESLESGDPLDPGPAENHAARIGATVAIVDEDGVTVLDTADPIGTDLGNEPDVLAALAGRLTESESYSEELGRDVLTLTMPLASGDDVHGALRISMDTHELDERVFRFWLALGGVALGLLMVMALAAWLLARSLTRPLRQLETAADRFAEGDLRAMDSIVEAPAEIRRLGERMNTMALGVDHLLRTHRGFVADASHQLRSPLTALQLRLENIEIDLPDPPAADEMAAAIQETERLGALVSSLLELAHIDAPRPPVVIDLARIAAERADTWTAMAEQNDVTITLDVAPDTGRVVAAQGATEQILDNLLDNALTASPRGGTVTVTLRNSGDHTALRIADEGPGLTPQQRMRATDRFWRADPSGAGSGLGLSIVARLVEASRGMLALDEAPGGGLAVTVTLPNSMQLGPRHAL